VQWKYAAFSGLCFVFCMAHVQVCLIEILCELVSESEFELVAACVLAGATVPQRG
jgi:hypothetical protein